MSSSVVLLIAKNELARVLRNPIIIIIGLILFAVTFINAAGDYDNLIGIAGRRGCDGLIFGYGQIYFITNFICGIMAAFLGMMAISEDRFKGSFNVLLSKPIYRRDFILGKYLGLSGFIVLFLTLEMIANFIMLLYFYGEPYSLSEVIIRISSYILVLSLDLVLVLGLTMLIGVVCEEILTAAALVVTYLSFEWFWNQGTALVSTIIHIPLTPYLMTGGILFGNGAGNSLFNTSTSYYGWLISALPAITVMGMIVIAILLANCLVFSRADNL